MLVVNKCIVNIVKYVKKEINNFILKIGLIYMKLFYYRYMGKEL